MEEPERLIYKCSVGSWAYRLQRQGSDWDDRGIYVAKLSDPNFRRCYDFRQDVNGKDEKGEKDDRVFYDIGFFLDTVPGSAAMMEYLFTPIVKYADKWGQHLLDMKHEFISNRLLGGYQSLCDSHIRKFRNLMKREIYRPKHLMHSFRWLLSGIQVAEHGEPMVRVPKELREPLRDIRDGKVSIEEATRKLEELRREFHMKVEQSLRERRLPQEPDYGRINDFHNAIRSAYNCW